MGRGELCTGGGKPDAISLCCRARNLLDRTGTDLAWDTRWKGNAWATYQLRSGCSHHRRASQICAAAGPPEGAGNKMDRVMIS